MSQCDKSEIKVGLWERMESLRASDIDLKTVDQVKPGHIFEEI